MITVNTRDFEWQEGMTVQSLLDAKKYTFPRIVVKVNSKLVRKEQYATYPINDGDVVDVIHMIGGG